MWTPWDCRCHFPLALGLNSSPKLSSLRPRPPPSPAKAAQDTVKWICPKKLTRSWQRHRLVNANPESLMMRVAIDLSQRSISENLVSCQGGGVVREAENQGSIILSAWWSNPWGSTYQSDCSRCLLTCNPSCMFSVCVCVCRCFLCLCLKVWNNTLTVFYFMLQLVSI